MFVDPIYLYCTDYELYSGGTPQVWVQIPAKNVFFALLAFFLPPFVT
jgi:hypothetical protein